MFLTVKGLTKSYETGVKTPVLKGLSLTLEQGRVGVILGPSGSGKSTLMNIIGGVDRADRGSVTVDGLEVTALDDNGLTEYRRSEIGFVFQFYNLVPNLTVGENIEVVSHISQNPLKLEEVLEAVGLAGMGGALSPGALRRGAAAGVHRQGHSEKPKTASLR